VGQRDLRRAEVCAPKEEQMNASPHPLCPSSPTSGELAWVDASLDVQDGSRAIQVTTFLGDTPIAVRHLTDPSSGRVRPLSWAFVAGAGGALLAGLRSVAIGQYGGGAVLLLTGISLGVLAWLRVREERQSPHFTLGEGKQVDLPLEASLLPTATFPLVRSTGSEYELLFTQAMRGELSSGRGYLGLDDLISNGWARPAPGVPGAFLTAIPADGQVLLSLGEASLLIRSVPPARRLKGRLLAGLDAQSQLYSGLSFVLHVVALALVFAMPPGGSMLDNWSFERDRAVILSRHVPKQDPDRTPAWLAKEVRESGAPAAATKGEQGRMGRQDSKKRHVISPPKGVAPDARLAKSILEGAKNSGVLSILGRSGLAPSLDRVMIGGALDDEAKAAIEGLQGDPRGEDGYGVGGLGLTGTGRFGGGHGEGFIYGGDLHTIGDKGDGRPYGRVGGLVGRLNGRNPGGVPPVRIGTAVLKGALDREIIRREIRKHLNEVRFCYQKELQGKPDLSGRVMVQFTILGTGRVAGAAIQSSTMNHSGVETCLTQAVTRWSFPQPKDGGIVVVSYPFMFHAPEAK